MRIVRFSSRYLALLPACALLCASVFGASAQNSMQGVPNAMQGFSQNRNKPVQIEAGSLEVRDKDKAATFSGDVKVVQGDTTMRSKTLVVFYEQESPNSKNANPPAKQPAKQPAMTSAAPGPTGSSQIRRLEARGGVIVTQKEQTVTGELGIFDMKTNTVTMSGGVVLTDKKNVLKGDRLVVDMTTGVSRVEMDKGRVQMLIDTEKQNGGGGPPSLLPMPQAKTPAPAANPATKSSRGSEPMQLNPPR